MSIKIRLYYSKPGADFNGFFRNFPGQETAIKHSLSPKSTGTGHASFALQSWVRFPSFCFVFHLNYRYVLVNFSSDFPGHQDPDKWLMENRSLHALLRDTRESLAVTIFYA